MLNKFAGVREKLSPGLRKIIRSVGWLYAEKVLRMVLSLSVGIYVIRYLGSEAFGKLSYSASFVGLFGAIAKLGLDAIVVRNVVQDEKATEEIIGTAFFLKLIGGVITISLICTASLIFIDDVQGRWMTLIIAMGLIFQAFDAIDFWFQSKVISGPMAVVRSCELIFSSVLKIIFIALRLPLIAFIWLLLVEYIFRAGGMYFTYLKHGGSLLAWRFSNSRAKQLLQDSWPLILSAMMITIYMKIDQVMLGNMVGNEAVGNYAAAVRFSEIWYFVPVAFCASVFPAIIRAKQRSTTDYYQKLQVLYDLMVWMSFSIAIPITLGGNGLMKILLGEEYLEAGNILALHIWAGPFVFLGVAQSKWLMAENLTRFSFATTSLGSVSNVVLNFLLIPTYGGMGAALATVISYAVSSHFSCLLYRPTFQSGLMLTKALFIPFRGQQNLIYLGKIRSIILR
ncbi:MAG: flippase [Gomphosphaeria aponina SAG 52.96 = DSM 107014]|uniref:Flippase n=1 Tax=Gomphosphaeria aponina SAG 52.96 = DSM 107014 TaxID=1521640 RepID=A0A941GS15_9CHRO|nr:flippase [Gomphosphaeria aponina SAG 52.96 = DSM 107014]